MLYLDHFLYDGQRPAALQSTAQQREVLRLLEKLATLEREIAACRTGRIEMTSDGNITVYGFPEALDKKIERLLRADLFHH